MFCEADNPSLCQTKLCREVLKKNPPGVFFSFAQKPLFFHKERFYFSHLAPLNQFASNDISSVNEEEANSPARLHSSSVAQLRKGEEGSFTFYILVLHICKRVSARIRYHLGAEY